MKTTIAILLATVGLASASLIPITIDIGPTRTIEPPGAQIIFNFDLNEPVGDGHKTFVISFANDQYIRLTERSTHFFFGTAGFELGLSVQTTEDYFINGFFPLVGYDGGFPLLIFGGTFDLQLPGDITGGIVHLTSNEFFGIGPHVPDSGTTLPMLGLGLTALLMGRRK